MIQKPAACLECGQQLPIPHRNTMLRHRLCRWKATNRRRRQTAEYRRKEIIRNQKNQRANRERYLQYAKEGRMRLRQKVWDGYGGAICKCCGESHKEFLCIDHINGGGLQHRRYIGVRSGLAFYRWLIKEGFPSGYQVLCFNCNQAKGFSGYCPHKLDSPIPP